MDLESLFAQYGYLALIFGSFADGTPIMLFGGFAAHRGWLELIPFVILAGAVGNFAAATAWFFGVRAIGEKILTRRPEWAAQVVKVRAQLDRWEVPVILGVRFLPGIATAGLIAVALSGISAVRFLVLNAIAAVLWATSFGVLGYLLGHSVELLLGEVERYEEPIALVLLVITAAWIGVHQWHRWGRGPRSRHRPCGASDWPCHRPLPAPRRRRATSASSVHFRSASAGSSAAASSPRSGSRAVDAGGAAWLAFLVGGVVALLTAYCWCRPGQFRLVVGLLALPFACQFLLRWGSRPRPAGARRPVARRRGLRWVAMLVGAYLLAAYAALPWAWWLVERGRHPPARA